MSNLITVNDALKLRNLGYNEEKATRYAYRFGDKGKYRLQKGYIIYRNSDNPFHILSVPTVDEVIDWLRRKYNVIIVNSADPFVNPVSKYIEYGYKVKQCNPKWGWNQREYVGGTVWSCDINAAKRMAIRIAIRHILKKKQNRRCKSSVSE